MKALTKVQLAFLEDLMPGGSSVLTDKHPTVKALLDRGLLMRVRPFGEREGLYSISDAGRAALEAAGGA